MVPAITRTTNSTKRLPSNSRPMKNELKHDVSLQKKEKFLSSMVRMLTTLNLYLRVVRTAEPIFERFPRVSTELRATANESNSTDGSWLCRFRSGSDV